jgi:hypothetical protein
MAWVIADVNGNDLILSGGSSFEYVHQHDQWYEQLAVTLAKEPRVPITPGTTPSKDF